MAVRGSTTHVTKEERPVCDCPITKSFECCYPTGILHKDDINLRHLIRLSLNSLTFIVFRLDLAM
jgi:hypothetical protein